ncbi:MAG: hypothetical protein RLZZ443_494 [Actinomycetota bacterium]
MLTIVLGFATALVYGFADFFGAISSRRINAILVTFCAVLSGLVFLLFLTPIFGMSFDAATLTWGIAAGLISSIAMSCLYTSLAIGPISILSPVGAVVSAIVPTIVGFMLGDRFNQVGWLALILVLAAVFLVGFVPGKDVRRPSLKGLSFAIAAGTGIGLVLICLHQAPQSSGLAPILLLRGVSAGVLGATLLLKKFASSALRRPVEAGPLVPNGTPKRFWGSIALTGIFDASAVLFFLIASRIPDATLTVVSVLTALYPLGTIVLARVFLKEKIALIQQFGILLALGGSALLAVA